MNQADLVKRYVLEHYNSKKSRNRHYSFRSHAKFLDVSISTYSSFISGKRELSLSLLKKISDKLSDLYPELKALERKIEPQRFKFHPIEIKTDDYKIKINFSVLAFDPRGIQSASCHIERIRKSIEVI